MKRVFEPVRQSLLDVIRENLHAAGRTTYVTRIVYIGEYFSTPQELEEKMGFIIRDIQADYPDLLISGLFLVYPQYYIHVLEAPEDIIYIHLQMLHRENNGECKIGKTIILPFYHHVHQRFFTKWFHVYVVPPTLLDKVEVHSLRDVQQQMSNCLVKVYTLCDYISSAMQDKFDATKDILQELGGKVAEYLPESTLLQSLFNSKIPHFLTIEDYVKMYSTVPYINLYNDSIWPPPGDCMLRGASDKNMQRRIERRSSIKENTPNIDSQNL